MNLASEGLPSPKNIGYALFDKSSIGMTDFLQKVNFKRALEGELSRTISGLEEVSSARVHLVIPEDKLFEEDQNPPSASVVLKVRGHDLSKQQLKGVSYLVASAVEGVPPENVTIIDYNGNLLSSQQANDPTAMLSATQFEMRKNVENYLEQKAQTLLAGVIGAGKAIVRVSAELNFEQENTQIESYDPDNVAIRSEQRTSQRGNQSENIPTESMSGAQTSTVTDNTEDIITNYEVPRTVRSVIGEVGSIERLSVAVIVDGNYEETVSPEGVSEKEYVERSQEELQRLSAIIKNAVGYSESRSDQFEIVNVPFDNNLLERSREEIDTFSNYGQYIGIAKKVGTILLVIVAFFYLKKKLRKVLAAVAKYVPPPPPPPTPAPEAEVEQKQQKPKLIDTMKTQAKGKNEEIAKVIKTMMSE
jgi:flagellar M-ring protein FliF